MNNRMKKLIAAVILLAGGAVFIVFGCITLRQMKTFDQVPAVVTKVAREWTTDSDGSDVEDITIYVTYTVDGKEYTESLQNTKTNYKEGDEITVFCDPSDPTNVTGASKGGAALQLTFGGVIALAGLATAAGVIIKGR